ncbi:InlB B-repeat-containing protein [Acholeplasma laidlawii]|uniref:InlB B-repeat-containing protein n=1 Tax=Acholeplasma laidlawii TaxID=2148 RepID=UPI00084CC6CD|nr:InlB B-repeat-containing protein [Acholeplasma laidlawii]OED59032.1 hypothetical protein BHS12_04830 [Acholeplasma laidlawii]
MKSIRVKKSIAIYLVILCITSLIILLNQPNQSPEVNEDKITISYRTPYGASVFMAEGQDGTETNPYIISNAEDMNALSLAVLAGNTFAGKVIVVSSTVNEIGLGNFIPIGSPTKPFAGTFDGFGVKFILNINRPESDYQGLFGYVNGGVIENLSVSGRVFGKSYVAGIAGFHTNSRILNVYNEAFINGALNYVGGITGQTYYKGILDYAYNTGEIIGGTYVGGITGGIYAAYTNNSYLRHVYSRGKVAGKGSVGGVYGVASGGSYLGLTNAYYDVIVIANYYQPEGYVKPSSLETTAHAKNSQQLYDMDSKSLHGDYWHFESRTEGFGFYPQLKYFINHPNDTLTYKKNSSIQSVKVDITDGIGTQSFPFIIYNEEDFIELNNKVKNGNTFEGFYFKVADGVTRFVFEDYEPIGTPTKRFYGTFDGNNAEFHINTLDTTKDYQALFGYFGVGAIRNLYVTGSVKGNDYVSGVVAYQVSGTVENVYNLASIEGRHYTGGVVGYMTGATVQRVYNHGKVTSTGNYVGGVVGAAGLQSHIYNTYNRGEVIGADLVGGIVGQILASYQNNSNIRYNYNAAYVSSKSRVGGVYASASGSYLTDTNNYYDTSILTDFDPGLGYNKPGTTNIAQGKTSDFLLFSELVTLGYNAAIWELKAKSGDYAYYPQLKIFTTNPNVEIKLDSIDSVKMDVSYGFGTKTTPFLIKTEQDMHDLSLAVSKGNTYLNYHFKVDAGLTEFDLGNFIPIGSPTKPFLGSFDGNGANFILDINRPDSDYQGLFGYHTTGVIENLSVSGSVTGRNYVSGIVGYHTGSRVQNVYNTANITGTGNYVGGITGQTYYQGILDYAYNTGEIIGGTYVGGITGGIYAAYTNNSYLRHVYSRGKVAGKGSVGGVYGVASGGSYLGLTNAYYDVIVIANYYQPEGLIKPSSLETALHAKNTSQMIQGSALLPNTHFYFEEKTDELGYYPQLKVFSQNEVAATKTRSKESVTLDIKDGMGTSDMPFIIYNEEDFIELNNKVKNGNTFEGFYFKVADGVTRFVFEDYEPIGTPTKRFYGTFDGNNAEFHINTLDTTKDYQALFGYFGVGAIRNLYVTGSVKGNDYVSGVVAYQVSGTVENVYNLASIEGRHYTGGVVGYMTGATVQRVYNHGKVTSTGNYVGGVVGAAGLQSHIYNTYNRGEVIGADLVGGIVGQILASYQNNSNIRYNYNAAYVSSKSRVGGVYASASGSYLTNTNNYYEVTMLRTFTPLSGYVKPSDVVGGQGLDKATMFNDQMLTRGFNLNTWTFKEIEGNYAYFPQLKYFAENANEHVVNDSIISTRTNPFTGDGTKESPYLIRNVDDMVILSHSISHEYDALGKYYIVAPNVFEMNLVGTNYKPIGQDVPFKGHFDGDYTHFIIELDMMDKNYVGLFGQLSSGASISNLSVSGSIKGNNYVGGVAGKNDGQIENVYAKVHVTGNQNIGGLVGFNKGSLDTMFSTGNVTGNQGVGGLVGFNEGTIHEGYYGGRIHGQNHVGALVGFSSNELISNLNYNGTIIYYDDILDGFIKPNNAVGNLIVFNHFKVEKEALTGIEVFSQEGILLSNDLWKLSPTNGLYDYYPQLKSFAEHASSVVRTNALLYTSVIRFANGSGSKSNPYIIRHEADMKALSDITKSNNLDGIYFKVIDGVSLLDLTIEGLGFERIGHSANINQQFKGGFDGNGVTIQIELLKTTTDYLGLFGYLGQNAEVKNIEITGKVHGRNYVGALAGEINGASISNIFNHAEVLGTRYVGGLIGLSTISNINNIYNMANVTAISRDVGGIIGFSQTSTISKVFNFGHIKGIQVVGGIVGYLYNANNVSYVYNRGMVEGTTTATYIGGITGAHRNGQISQGYSAGVILGKNTGYLGGLIGRIEGTTFESDIYYDASIIDSIVVPTGYNVPIQSIGNKLNQEHIKGLSKTEIVGLKGQSNMTLDSNEWVFIETNGVEAFYPQLKVFSTHLSERVQKDSIESVKSYVFVGEGSFDVPYVIVNKYDMEILSNLVSSGIDFEGIYFKVKEDVPVIDLTYEVNYKPIGSIATQFKGSFDGTHTNFVVKMNTSSNYQGLFGYLGDTAHVKNLSVSGSITGNNFVGSIAGVNYGVIENVFTTADLVGKDNVGGITGTNHGEVRVSYAIGSVRGNEHIGGISGNNTGIISDGYVSSNIYGTSYVGGIVGSNASELYNLYYNESKIEVSPDITGYSKPFIATGNQGNTDSVYGVVSHKLYSGTLVFENEWTFENSVGFYAYYPQIKGFSKSIYKLIKDYSKDSVTISKFNEGSGTFEDPYIIRTHYDMESVSQMIGARYSLLNTYFKVASDVDYIDLTLLDKPYVPIGNSSVNFQGSFDGQGVKFNINLNNNFEYQGLFGVIGTNGYVKNVSVEGSIKGTNFIGGISGRNYGIIENSYNLAHITGTNYIGGISGYANHDIINTFNTGNIQSTGVYVGGITGGIVRNRMIKNAYNVGNIHSTLSTSLRGTGGIAGYLGGNLYNVYQASPITSERSGYISGLYGRTDGVSVIENAYFAIEPILNDTSGYFKPSTISPNAVYKNQLTSEQLFVTFGTGVFVSRQSQAFDAFYPQLKVFETSSKSHITTDSRNSVMHPLLYGEGTSINPYLIYSSYDLRGLGIAVKDGLDTIDQVYKVYQDAVIDFEPIKNLYEPIGTYSNPFKATFDGSNQTINLKIENPNKDYQGLFGVVSEDALIKDLLLEGKVQGKHYVGALAGRLNGVVSNIYIKDMVVTGHDYVGLLAGDSQITELSNISLKGVVEGLSYVGGMIGHSQTITANATYFMGSIYASSNYVGGLIGYIETESILTNVFSSGVIHASESNYVGGLFGHFKGILENAYATTSITANSYAAGIAAIHEGEMNEIFYSGQLSANSYAAGIVVENKGLISNAYYNSTEIENMKQLDSNKLVKHAIYNVEDSAHVSARTLSEMTFIYSLGDDITQMNFNQSLYQTKQGTDFTTYFPELYIFIDHAHSVFVEDSLESITYKKIEGLGTKLNPYLIYDGYDMMVISDYVRSGHEFVGKYFEVAPKVTQIDLTLEDLGYTPIGSNEYNFGGIFDGKQARFIIELSTNSEYLGIFHTIGETAKVSNMVITGNIRGHAYLGGLAGRNLGTIENVYNHAHITSTLGNDIGGIVGFNQGTIKLVTNQGKITSNGSYTGGITGQNDGVIIDAYNRNDVTGFSNVAGITGHNMGEISNSYNSGHILAKDSIAAGIAGTNSSIINQVYNSGQITATNQNAAGIVGNFSAGNLSEAYNAGMILSKKGQAAGIAAYMNTGSISNVYQFGEIYSVEDIGIIIGFIENGNLASIYYDKDIINEHDLSGYKKPEYSIGNKLSDVRSKSLYHGQMIGMHALSVTNMNLANPNKYKMLPSLISTSFYPQFTVFSNSSFDYVREDSLKSVETHTFIVGDGSMVNPYLIRNESDWLALADSTTNGNTYKGVYFEVSHEIDELNFVDHPSNYKFQPVGTKDKPFSGILDGKGINVRINTSNQLDYQALFGHIGTTGEVRNISVSGNISARNHVAGIAAINDGLIENVYNQAVILGNQYVSGIAATNNGVIKNVYNKGKVTGTDYVAGLTAYLNGTLYNSYNTGVIYGKNHIGMLVGFYHTGSINNSYFDVTLLGAYRNTTTHSKPLGAVGSSFNGDNVKGLDHRFMIGQNVFGASSNQMNFVSPTENWSTNYNLNELNENYPQLKVFAQDSRAHIQALSQESTYNKLYKVTFEELNETTNENLQYVLDNEHYQLYVPTYFGYNFLGWYYDEDGIEIQLTNKSGQSIQVFNEEKDIEVYAKWEEAYHLVQFIDGNNKVIHEEEIRHGQYVQQPEGLIPLKNKDALYVYEYMRWIFDFNGTQILKPTQIRAEYHQMDRYYTINYYDGDGHLFERQKGEYNQYIQPTSKIPTKTYDTYAYHFEGWDYNFNVVITETKDIYPIFTPVQRYYEIKFYNYDGIHLETKMGEYLFSVEPPSVLPIKAQTPEFKYEFSGWDKDISSITTSMDVIAQFKEVRRSYTVNFFNGDGSILSSQQVLYGDMAAHPSEVPTQTPAGNDAYKFDGWIEDYSYITENLNVRPKFIRVDRYYEVSFYDAFDKIIDKVQVVEYLNSAVQPLNNPTKPSSVSEIYTFDGWDQDFTVITGNLEIYPVFKSSPRTYQVTFMIDQDTVYKTVETEYGKTAILPEGIPFKEGTKEIGYKFISWGANYKNITSDTLVYANYQEVAGQYLITFTDGATILNTQYVLYGKDAVAPDLTTYLKDHPNQATGYEYYFISWSSTLNFITAEKTINLNKGSRLIQYEVTLINGDETTKIQVGWGQNVTFPVGYKTSTNQIKYTFVGWDNNGLSIKENRTIKALFDETYLYYEVRFYDKFNNLIKLQEVAPGSNALAPAVDIIDQQNGTLLIFNRWDKDFTNVEENLNVYAIYDTVNDSFTVNFYDAFNKIISSQIVKYNEKAIAPNAPSKIIDGPYAYEFIGWSEDFSNVKSNLEIYPEYEEKEITFTVNFFDGDNRLIKTDYVKYGLDAIAPSVATKTPTQNIYYIFDGWKTNYSGVTKNLDIEAKFIEVPRYYTVNFFDKDDNIINTQIIEYGQDAKDPRFMEGFNPIISYLENDQVLVISGWDQDLINVRENRTIYALYSEVNRYYEVRFYDALNNQIGDTQIIEYGSKAFEPTTPIKVSPNPDFFYLFTGWSEPSNYVTENLEIYPTYNYVKTTYQVTFLDGNGNVFDEQTISYGQSAITPNGIPSKTPTDDVSYVFKSWDVNYDVVTSDLIVRPIFDMVTRQYLVIFKNDKGIIIKEELVNKGSSAKAPDVPILESDNYYHYMIRWSVKFDNVTEDIVTELYYEKIERIYTLTFYDYDTTTIISTITATYGQVIMAPSGPIKPADRQFSYEFISWNPVFNEVVTSDENYYPYYEEHLRVYIVTFLDGNGNVFDEQEVYYGATPKMPLNTPTKDPNKQYYYTFRMWETLTVKVYEDITIKAIFYNHLQEYEVTFIDEFGHVIEKQMVKYGEGAVEPNTDDIPVKSSTTSTVYVFSGWDKTFSFITEDLIVQTQYLGTPRKFIYTFYDDDQTTILKQIVGAYGDPIIEPNVVNKPGGEGFDYAFDGWDKVVPEILTEHMIFVARYKEVYKEYKVTLFDGNGALFKTLTVLHGQTLIPPTEIPSKLPTMQYTFVFSHWVIKGSTTVFNIFEESVTQDIQLEAAFNQEIRLYVVTYMSGEEVHEEVIVPYNGRPIIPSDPEKPGYRFTNWDKHIDRVTGDMTVHAVFVAGRYNIIFNDGYNEGDEVIVEGSMTPMTVNFDDKVVLTDLGYVRKGYDFMGWVVDGNVLPSYGDGDSFTYNNVGSLVLTAYWQPISYGISYDLNGGLAINPTMYTIEDYIRFNQANKNGYKFVGWYMVEQDETSQDMRQMARRQANILTNEFLGTYIEEIKPNTVIGSIKLTAVYEYDSYIKLKPESMLGMFHAEVTSVIPIEERNYYDETNPIYLMGVFQNQTWANLKENFVNKELYFLDKNGKELTDQDIVASGRMIVIKDSNGNITDRVHVVLKGDTNGDGRVNALDLTNLINHLNKKIPILAANLIASEINGDGKINALDQTRLINHLNNSNPFWDKDQTSTMN